MEGESSTSFFESDEEGDNEDDKDEDGDEDVVDLLLLVNTLLARDSCSPVPKS